MAEHKRSDRQLEEERALSKAQIDEERAFSRAQVDDERAYSRAQIEEERGIAREREQIAEAYAVQVVLSEVLTASGDEHLGPGEPVRRLAVLIVNRGKFTITRIEAQFSYDGMSLVSRPKPQVQIRDTGSNYRRHRAAGLPGFNAQALEQGQRPRQSIREISRVAAPPEIAKRLQIAEDVPVIVRRRIFMLEEQPAALTDSYYPADMAGGTAIEEPGRIKGGVHALIEDPDGPIRRQIACSVDDITGRMPTPGEARGAEAFSRRAGVPCPAHGLRP